MLNRFPILRALLCQLLAVGATMIVARLAAQWARPLNPVIAVAIQSTGAAGLGYLFGLRYWWLVVNLAFGPLILLLINFNVPPWVYLGSLVVLALLYSNSITRGVPLYLSGQSSLACLCERIARHRPAGRIIDLGCGLGSAVSYLARAFRGATVVGIENAPLAYLIARLRSLVHPNATVQFGSIWEIKWDSYDVVYCFLSPVPMPDVWKKARAEMKPGSLLISNTFEIPGVPPHEVIDMADWRSSKIYIWKI